MKFPNNLYSSREEYNKYCECLKNLRRGDKIKIRTLFDEEIELDYVLTFPYTYQSDSDVIIIMAGADKQINGDGVCLRTPVSNDRTEIANQLSKKRYPSVRRKYVGWIYSHRTRIGGITKYDEERDKTERLAKRRTLKA